MFKRLLVPTDGSDFSEISLDYAISLAKKFGAQINLLHITDSKVLAGNFLVDLGGMTGAVPFFNLKKDISRVMKEKAKLVLSISAAKCKKAKIKSSQTNVSGIISKAILEASQLNDIVIMGQHGENAALSHGLLGSSMETVVRKCPKPIMITPTKMTNIKSVLLAYDASPSAKNALKYTAELSRELKLKLFILTNSSAEITGKKILNEAANYLSSYKIKPKTLLVTGSPTQSILIKAKATKAGLIVMGFHGHSLIRDLILGSTTEGVIRKSHVPVLLCH